MTEKEELLQYLNEYLQAIRASSQVTGEVHRIERAISALKCEPEPALEVRCNGRTARCIFSSFWALGALVLVLLRLLAALLARLVPFCAGWGSLAALPLQIAGIVLLSAAFGAAAAAGIVCRHNGSYAERNRKNQEMLQARRARIADLERRLAEVEEQRTEIYRRHNELEERHIVPPFYNSDFVIECLIQYLEDGRANTLEEALKVFDQNCQIVYHDWKAPAPRRRRWPIWKPPHCAE